MDKYKNKIIKFLKKTEEYLFAPRFKFSRIQLNLFAILFTFIGGGITIFLTVSSALFHPVLALTESTYLIGNGGNASLTSGTSTNVTATTGNVILAKDSNWFDVNWNYKLPLTLKNIATSNLTLGTVIQLSINTSSLVLRSDCNDLRIVYQNNTDLPRDTHIASNATTCNNSVSTLVSFRLQAALNSATSDSTNYFLYYGNSNASTPSNGLAAYSIKRADNSVVNATLVCPFNETTTCVGGVVPSASNGAIRQSKNSALYLDGVNDWINVPGNSAMDVTDVVTIETWVYLKSYNPNSSLIIARTGAGEFYRLLISSAGKVQMAAYGTSRSVTTSNATLGLNVWTHIVGVYDGSNKKIYINGALDIADPTTGSMTGAFSSALYLGGFSGGAGAYFNGYIDELAIYHKAMSTSEVTARYNNNNSAPISGDSSTILLYHFDENGDDARFSGKVKDASGNNFDGTLTNGATFVSGLTGVDSDSITHVGKVPEGNYAAHEGVFVENGTTNYITNPSAEVDTSNWSCYENPSYCTLSRSTTYAKFGTASFHAVTTASGTSSMIFGGRQAISTYGLTAGNSFCFSSSIKVVTGSATLSTVWLDSGNNVLSTISSSATTANDWVRMSDCGTVPTNSVNVDVKVTYAASSDVYSDGFQFENGKTIASTYADGSLGTGYAWSGTANASTSTRTTATLAYPTTNNISANAGSVSLWWKSPTSSTRTIRLFNTNPTDTKSIMIWTDASSPNYIFASTVSSPNAAKNVGSFIANHWYHIVFTWNGNLGNLYVDNSTPAALSYAQTPNLSTITVGSKSDGTLTADSTFSDLRIYDQAITSSEVSYIFYSGLQTHSYGTLNQTKYASSGTWESPVIDLSSNGEWGISPNFVATQNLNGYGIIYETRTSDDSITWGVYAQVTGTAPNYIIASTPRRYLQVRATLSSNDKLNSPSFSNLSIHYVPDTIPPVTNSSNLQMYETNGGGTVTSGNWVNSSYPFFTWNAGADNTNGTGIKGYCLYLGSDGNADPATAKGLLGNSPLSITNTTCQFITDQTSIDFVNSNYRGSTWLTTSDTPYYLNIKAIDNSGNIFSGSSAQFQFKFDNTPPTNVKFISPAAGNFSNVVDMSFSWPNSGSNGASDSNSGLLGYQYQLNSTNGTWKGTTHSNTLNLDYIPATDSSYTFTELQDGGSIISGVNTIYFRAIDQIGNTNTDANIRTGAISYGGQAPSFDNGSSVTITPSSANVNQFSLTWPTANASVGQTVKNYYYMINTTPPSTFSTLSSNPSTYFDNGTSTTVSTKALPNVNKGTNTVYVVAVDDAQTPNYSPSNYITGTFTLDSSNPDNVNNLVASDSSIKTQKKWNVTLTWTEPVYQGAGNLTYVIYRSSNGISFSQVGTTIGLSYVDNTPLSQKYYYKIVTKDGANAISTGTNAVSITPTGKYTSPANLIDDPVAINISNRKATIIWSTDRTSDSKVAYGTKTDTYYTEQPANISQVTNHIINLNNLQPGTVYFYKVNWTDEDGNIGFSEEKTFTTLPAPYVKSVRTFNIGLSSALVDFTSFGASKVRIIYGSTASFGASKEIVTSPSEGKYLVNLDGLTDNTKYYFKPILVDADGFEYEGDIYSFITLPRPKLSSIKIQEIKGTSQPTVMITWNSNTEVSSILSYYPEDQPNAIRTDIDINLIKGEHKFYLKNLDSQTNYLLTIKGRDQIGNEAVSDSYRFTTSTDTRPPSINNIKISSSITSQSEEHNAQLIISWDTDEPSSSQIEYSEGTGSDYSQKTQEDSTLNYNHIVVISNLSPSKVYHLRVVSKDKAGNTTYSNDNVTLTNKAEQNALDLVIKNLGEIFGF